MLYIDRVKLQNFRCFKDVRIEPDTSAPTAPWTLFTGDNASGKTTLLKAIALGLCDGSSAAGLLRESDSGYIRDQQHESTIEVRLTRMGSTSHTDKYTIVTRLSEFAGHLEQLEQTTDPIHDFPWDDIFVCGYGAGRGTSGTGDISEYSPINAVYNLFNYSEGLQNPELTIRRLQQDHNRHGQVLTASQQLLDISEFRLAPAASRDAGILVTDPRGINIALRDLADGYKSTFLWITDFLGWALANDSPASDELHGIVIIDEIEQHLHPKLQKRIVHKLRNIWPKVQFFASTHSPLVARSFRHVDENGPHRHYHLRTADTPHVVAEELPSLGGSRTDQILATQAFDYLLDDDPDADHILEELATLAGNEFLSSEDRDRALELARRVQDLQAIRTGQTKFEQAVADWIEMKRGALVDYLETELRNATHDSDP